jgi:ABC-type dipeptide/oligopeptide/nickel transport system permease subunit
MSQQGNENENMTARGILRRLVKGIFLGFAFGFLFVLLAMFIGALAGSTSNAAIQFLSDPVYMFSFGEFVGIGIEILPELEKD